MRYKHPIKQILIATRDAWDHADTRPAVRHNFDRVTKCGTLALGAEVFASQDDEKIVPPHLQVKIMSKLWSSSDNSMAAGTVVRSSGHSLFGDHVYHARCVLADIPVKPSSPARLASFGSCRNPTLGKAQVWRSRGNYGDTAHLWRMSEL